MEGDVLMAQKKSTLAIPLYERAFSLDKNPQLLSKLHTALKQAGKGSDADSRVMLWLKDHPEDLVTRMHLADSYVVENKNKEAIAQYQAILQRSPNTPAVLNNLAWAYFQEQDSRALEYAEKAHQYAADNPAVLDTLGWILVSQGNAARGLALLQKAMALAPENSDIRYHLAQALVASGDKVGARKELEKLLATGKTFPDKEAAKTLLKQL